MSLKSKIDLVIERIATEFKSVATSLSLKANDNEVLKVTDVLTTVTNTNKLITDEDYGGLIYISQWDAKANTPTLTNSDPSKFREAYISLNAFTRFGEDWKKGDYLVYDSDGNIFKEINPLLNIVSTVGFSNEYDDLVNKPSIPSSIAMPIFSTVLPNSIGQIYRAPSNSTVRELGNIIKSSQDNYYYTTTTFVDSSGDQDIRLLKSSDLITWTDEGIIAINSEDPYLVENEGNYYLYVEDKEPTKFRNIKLYKSSDLLTWTDEGVILDYNDSSWESQDVSSPAIIVEDGTWYMYYEGRADNQLGAIGLATSSDGINWTKSSSSNPIISGTNLNSDITWADHIVPDDVIKSEGLYFMTAHAKVLEDDEWFCAVLVSNDLVNWTDMLGTWGNKVNYTDEAGYGTMLFQSKDYGLIASFINEGDGEDQRSIILGSFGVSSNYDLKEKVIKAKRIEATTFIGDGAQLTGINADTLDNLNSLDFVRKTGDVNEIITGIKTYNESIELKELLFSNAKVVLNKNPLLTMFESVNSRKTIDVDGDYNSGGFVGVYHGGNGNNGVLMQAANGNASELVVSKADPNNTVGANADEAVRAYSRHISNTNYSGIEIDGDNPELVIGGTASYASATYRLLVKSGDAKIEGDVTADRFFESSDKRLKTNIKKISKSIYTYEFKTELGKKRYGTIAQDLKKTNSELVKKLEDNEMMSVDYNGFLCMKIAEQENKTDDLQKQINELKELIKNK